MPIPGHERLSFGAKALAWIVHALTASGAVLAFLAVIAILEQRWHLAFFWLALALLIDGLDGSLARAARVKERAGRIDGDTLDLVVDYLTYVFVPTLFIWRAGLVPDSLVVPLAAAIQLSSLYHFARADLKSEDNYFRGFPALWNVVAYYLFVADAAPLTGAIVVCVLAALSFAPILVVHPFRVREFRPWLQILTVVGATTGAALLWPGWSAGARGAILGCSLAAAAAMTALGLVRTFRGPATPKGS